MVLDDILTVDSNVKYWMVRTQSGNYYEDYVKNGFIAIGYNTIKIEDLQSLPKDDDKARFILREKLWRLGSFETQKQTHYPASQMLRFYRAISKGDYIMAPSAGSEDVSFGIVEGAPYQKDGLLHDGDCPYIKRIPVKWMTHKRRNMLDPSLQLVFSSRHIISDITPHGEYFDSVVNDYYNKDGVNFLVIRIGTTDGIECEDFFAINKLFSLIDSFCKEYNICESSEDVQMKIHLESPGTVRLICKTALYLGLIGFSLMFINGGGFNIDNKYIKISCQTNGIFKNLSDFLDRRDIRKTHDMIRTSFNRMKIESPKKVNGEMILDKEQSEYNVAINNAKSLSTEDNNKDKEK